ncbi:tyrosine-protein phosphatase [Cellulomonas chengniuliangii]|uniref:Tyrosine-protein phosphatase n=1 Tax=Cellulomonas chengniuliangii TaxID=2968084 RepID=A0ABY5L163_9CELL|nr:tyrosine-protein phosphatase [Cellulomonas chengniuliangii]MCC2307058.1 tyrosine-protein phosphatase [Cellulomonas chengniuliangii]MCC2316441.1 tyrosine-protein phosphatase [Cellulomonas chengniuliangii]UUI76139.1 tyrosine-protein phosphatase [Cellulomonas chengniuliangii]
MPERAGAALAAVADADEGGVLFHCVAGRDRTGLVAMLLLSLVGCGSGRDRRRLPRDGARRRRARSGRRARERRAGARGDPGPSWIEHRGRVP